MTTKKLAKAEDAHAYACRVISNFSSFTIKDISTNEKKMKLACSEASHLRLTPGDKKAVQKSVSFLMRNHVEEEYAT